MHQIQPSSRLVGWLRLLHVNYTTASSDFAFIESILFARFSSTTKSSTDCILLKIRPGHCRWNLCNPDINNRYIQLHSVELKDILTCSDVWACSRRRKKETLQKQRFAHGFVTETLFTSGVSNLVDPPTSLNTPDVKVYTFA